MNILLGGPMQGHITALENIILDMRIERVRDRAIIAQVRNTRRIQRQYATTHNHLDLIAMRRAQDELDDLLEPLTAVWPALPRRERSDPMIAGGGEM